MAGRRYFLLALDAIHNISERSVSRLSGQDIFVISVPLSVNGQIVGTMQRYYRPDEMYALCSIFCSALRAICTSSTATDTF